MADDDPPAGGWDAPALGAALGRWASGRAAADAATARARERWLGQEASESATLTGVLVDLAERGETVTVATRSGQWTGRVTGVGRDFCVVAAAAATIVALPAVVSVSAGRVRPGGGAGPGRTGGAPGGADVAGDRAGPLDLDLESVMALLASERSPVRLVLAGGSAVVGTLWGSGDGIVACRPDGPGRPSVTVVTAAVEACAPG